jgi:hypothetical protein
MDESMVPSWLRGGPVDDSWVPPREWMPKLEERIIDDRPESRGAGGVVVDVEIGGPHFADRDYWVDVRWDDGVLERRIASHWLYRMDGTQKYPRA